MSDDPGQGAGLAPDVLAMFEQGLTLFRAGDASGAHALFERAHRRAPSDARVMSWYGLTLVLVERNSNLGVAYGDQALRIRGPDAELYLNQARAHLALGQRERAVQCILRGLAVEPHDDALREAQRAMGWRRRPVLPFLARSNPVNRWLGRLRHKYSRALAPSTRASAMTLGVASREESK